MRKQKILKRLLASTLALSVTFGAAPQLPFNAFADNINIQTISFEGTDVGLTLNTSIDDVGADPKQKFTATISGVMLIAKGGNDIQDSHDEYLYQKGTGNYVTVGSKNDLETVFDRLPDGSSKVTLAKIGDKSSGMTIKHTLTDGEASGKVTGEKTFTIYKEDTTLKEKNDKIKALSTPIANVEEYKKRIQDKKLLYDEILVSAKSSEVESYLLTKLEEKVGETISNFEKTNESDVALDYINGLSGRDYGDFERFLTKLNTLTSLSAREKVINKYKEKLESHEDYYGENLNSINYSLKNVLSEIKIGDKSVEFEDVAFYFLNKKDGVLIFTNKSGSVDALNQDYLKNKIYNDAIKYLKDTTRIDINVKTVFISNDLKYLKENFVNSIDISKIVPNESLINYYEYLNFKIDSHLDGNNIVLLMKGEFGKKDSDWVGRKISGFDNFIKFNVAESIIREHNDANIESVIVKVFDNNLDLIYEKTVKKNEVLDSYEAYTNLNKKLNDEYKKFDGLDFKHTLTGRKNLINLRVKGTNFRESYDSWENIDKSKFETWIGKIGEFVLSEREADVEIKVLDKENKVIYETKLYKSDYLHTKKDIESYFNDNFYKKNGIYFEYKFTKGSDRNVLRVTPDVPKDTKWSDEFPLTSLELFAKELAGEVISKYPKDILIEFSGKNITTRTFSFDYKNFKELRELEEKINAQKDFSSEEYNINLNSHSGRIDIDMRFKNLQHNDSYLKELKRDKEFIKQIEQELITPIITKYTKSVYFTVKDRDSKHILSKSYGTDFKRKVEKDNLEKIKNEIKKVELVVKGNRVELVPSFTTHSNEIPSFYIKVRANDLKGTSAESLANTTLGFIKDSGIKDANVYIRDNRNNTVFRSSSVKDDKTDRIRKSNRYYVNSLWVDSLPSGQNIVIPVDNKVHFYMESKDADALKYKNIDLILKTGGLSIKLNPVSIDSEFEFKNGKVTGKNIDGKYQIDFNTGNDVKEKDNTSSTRAFSDVDSTNARYVNSLVNVGIVKGYPDGTFKGNKSLTRAEFATLLSRVITKFKPDIQTDYSEVSFSDLSDVHWAANDIKKLSNLGIIGGYPDGTFKPEKNVTESEILVLIARVLGNKQDNSKNWATQHQEFLLNKGVIISIIEMNNAEASRYDICKYLYKGFQDNLK